MNRSYLSLLYKFRYAIPLSLLFWGLVFLGISYATTYYVDNSITDVHVGSATPDYTTYNPATFETGTGSASVYKTLADIYATTFAGDDIILFRRGQAFNDSYLRMKAGGTSGHPIILDGFGVGANPLFNYNTTRSFYIDQPYLTLNRLHFSNKQVEMRATGTNVIFNYCLFEGSTGLAVNGTLAGGGITLNNCLILNNAGGGVDSVGAGTTIAMNNCIVSGNASTSGIGVRAETSGALTYTNSLITGNSFNSTFNISAGLTDGGNNLVEVVSKPVHYKNGTAYFVFTSDDHDVDYWKAISTALSPYGAHFTLYPIPALITGPEQTDLANLAAAGHEIGVHSYSHTNLTVATLFAVTSTNASPTVAVNRTAKTLTLTTTTPGNTVTVDWSSVDKTIADLQTAVVGKGWTITPTVNVGTGLRLKALSDTGGAQTVPYSPTPDVSSGNGYPFWAEEIADDAAWVTSATGVAPVTMAYPWGNNNATLQAYVNAVAGLKGARATTIAAGQLLSSVNIYDLKIIDDSTTATYFKGDGSEAVIRARARHYYEYCNQTGTIGAILAHSTSELTVAQITWIVDEIYKAGGQFITFSALIDAIKADHSTADNLTYTKTYTDASDFHLKGGSPAIDAGADLCSVLTNPVSDFADNPICAGGVFVGRGSGPEIGAYEYQSDNYVSCVATGNWNDISGSNYTAWNKNGGGCGAGTTLPTSTDTVTITAQEAITIPAGVSAACGTLTLNAGVTGTHTQLIIAPGAPGGSLQLDGAGTLNNYTDIIVGDATTGGGTLDLNGQTVSTANSAYAKLQFRGIPSNRFKVINTAGNGVFASGTTPHTWVDFSYGDFTGMGAASTFGGSTSGTANPKMVDHITWSGGDLIIDKCLDGDDWRFTNSDVYGGGGTNGLLLANSTIAAWGGTPTGQRKSQHNTFVGTGYTSPKITNFAKGTDPNNFLIDGNVFVDCFLNFSTYTADVNNTYIHVGNNGTNNPIAGSQSAGSWTMTGDYLYSSGNNDHSIYPARGVTLSVLEQSAASAPGSNMIVPTSGSHPDAVVSKNVFLGGNFFDNGSGSVTQNFTINNNTIYGSYGNSKGPLLIESETSGVFSGTVDIHSNLTVDSATASSANSGIYLAADTTFNLLDYNGWYGFPGGDVSVHYCTSGTCAGAHDVLGTPGVHDLAPADPQWLAKTRNFAAWDLTRGSGTGTAAAGETYLKGINGYRGTPYFDQLGTVSVNGPSDAVSWVRAGFAPQNSAYHGTGLGGVDVGALDYQSPSRMIFPFFTH